MNSRPNHHRSRGPGRLLAGLVTVALLLLLAPATASARDEGELTCERIPELLHYYLQKHIRFHSMNDELRGRVIESYARRLDPAKTLYLRSEALALEAKLRGVVLDVYDRECGVLDKIQPDLLARYQRMEDFVRKLVDSSDYEIDRDVSLVSDADKRARPATPEEQGQLLTKLVHFQMANYEMLELDPAEAKRKLIHRYELMTRRASEFDSVDVYAGFLDSFARALDPHSNYLSPESYEDFGIGMGLSLEGIGVALSSKDGFSVVEKIIPGGAADEQGGLKPQDKIVAVAQKLGDWVDVVDMDLRNVVKLIRGPRGTEVHLKVVRRESEQTHKMDVTLNRKRITLEEQAAKLRFEEIERNGRILKLAVIDLPSFYGDANPTQRQSSRDVRRLLKRVAEAEADGLLLDLSRNGGGLLENAVEIAGLFIDEGGVVAVKEFYSKLQVLSDPDRSIVYSGPLVVLTSRVSASASEIVAGAIQDYDRGIVVGDDRTFGKGTVQRMVRLEDGLGALKVTTAMYFRPGGISTQNDGVSSDIVIPSPFNVDDYGERHQPFALESQQIAPFVSDRRAGSKSRPGADWPTAAPQQLAILAQKSALRVSENDDFQEILGELEKNAARNGVIHISEILDAAEPKNEAQAEEDAAAADSGAAASGRSESDSSVDSAAAESEDSASEVATAAEEEEEPTLQQREALEILADFVSLTLPPELASAD